MRISFAGHDFILHHSGVLLWPLQRMAIVSDLHLEKSSHFALRGFFLPPYDSQETLQKLLAVCVEENVEKLLLLGDCFHDKKGFARMTDAARHLFAKLLAYQPIWIRGNHDADFVPNGFQPFDTYELNSLIFRHEALPGAVSEISGHFHPKVMLDYKGARIARPCFLSDERKMILPAFGSYTGGLDIASPTIQSLLFQPFNIYMLGQQRVFSLSTKTLAR